jgi:YfiH family protein
MKSTRINNLQVFRFDQSDLKTIPHGFFTRNGGVSKSPWKSLNLSTTCGDTKDCVIANRKIIFDAIEKPVETMYDVWQVHGNEIIITNKPRGLENPPLQADGIFTNLPGITLFMRFADCVPLLFFDPTTNTIGVVHAGWKGTVNRIVVDAVEIISNQLKVDPGNLIIGIGPSICKTHYTIGEDVVTQVRSTFGDYSEKILYHENGQYRLDLQEANAHLLRNSGVEKIEKSEICTACDTENWYSHRAESGITGRFGAYIFLDQTNG